MVDSEEPDFEENLAQTIEIHGNIYYAIENHGLILPSIEELGADAAMEDAYATRLLNMMGSESPASDDSAEMLMMKDFTASKFSISTVSGQSGEDITMENTGIPGSRPLRIISVSPDFEDPEDDMDLEESSTPTLSNAHSLTSYSSNDTVIWDPHEIESPEAISITPVVRKVSETKTLRRSRPPLPLKGPFRFLELPRSAKEAIYRISIDRETYVHFRYRNMAADINTGIWHLSKNNPFPKPALSQVCREIRGDMLEAMNKVPRIFNPSTSSPFLNELNELRFCDNEYSPLAPGGTNKLEEFTMFWTFVKAWDQYKSCTDTSIRFYMMAKVTISKFPAGKIAVRTSPNTRAEGRGPHYDDSMLVAWLRDAGIAAGVVYWLRPTPGYIQRWSITEFETANIVDDVEALHKAVWMSDLRSPHNLSVGMASEEEKAGKEH